MKLYHPAILLYFIFFLLFDSHISTAQSNFVSGSEIKLEVNKNGDLIYNISIDKGLTIYQLSKVFRIEPNYIYKYNNLKPDTPIAAGTNLQIPLEKGNIITQAGYNYQKNAHLRVMYVVKPGETLYRVSKVFFGQDIIDVQQRNNLKSDNLAAGDLLFMGYWSLEKNISVVAAVNKPKGLQSLEGMSLKNKDVTSSDLSESQLLKEQDDNVLSEAEWVSGQAIALWDKSNKMTKSLYVLHNDAKIGSEMELFFPLVQSSVKAKVVGRIPEGTYTEDIALYVSPKVARKLGVLDPRFQVNIKYLKQRT